tara:strand:+ start:7384 stop:8187 length:804 start_codon:yes stop_codon:yes gene_type:complete
MIQRLLVWLIQYGPKTKRWFWRVWYNVFAKRSAHYNFKFMNYGYIEHGFNPKLDLEDEKERYPAQLYNHTASQENVFGKNVLEIGSGRGGGAMHVLKYLKPKTIVGMDISKEAIRLCDSFYKAPGLSFMIGDSENLPFNNNTFDIVINVESSHCYGNIPQFLSEVQRVLNPNGFFLWADFRTRNEMDTVFNLFSNSGLALIREKNITKNVVSALDELTKTRKTEIETRVPKIFQPVFMSYAGIKGSSVYKSFVDGRFIYKSATLQKQ